MGKNIIKSTEMLKIASYSHSHKTKISILRGVTVPSATLVPKVMTSHEKKWKVAIMLLVYSEPEKHTKPT